MKVLVVEDEDQVAGMTQRELQREFHYDVVVASDLPGVTNRLAEGDIDVVVADILYNPVMVDFEVRMDAQRIRPSDRPLLYSGLSVIAAAHQLKDRPGIVVWTGGDTARRLHLLYAFEDLGVRSFCSKHSGNRSLAPLHRAITAAANRNRYIDNVLSTFLPAEGTTPLAKTLLREPKHRLIWRALALGYRTAEEISDVTPYSKKTVRTTWGDMFRDLQLVDSVPDTRKTQPELINYAAQNRYFFLDEAVRGKYP